VALTDAGTGKVSRLLDVLAGRRHALLVFPGGASEHTLEQLAPYGPDVVVIRPAAGPPERAAGLRTLVDQTGRLHPAPSLPTPWVCYVRPDGIVGWRAPLTDLPRLLADLPLRPERSRTPATVDPRS
jgi:hypothetical protein